MSFPKAAPMMTPTARSITLPLKANCRNSSRNEDAFWPAPRTVSLWSGFTSFTPSPGGPSAGGRPAGSGVVDAVGASDFHDLVVQPHQEEGRGPAARGAGSAKTVPRPQSCLTRQAPGAENSPGCPMGHAEDN